MQGVGAKIVATVLASFLINELLGSDLKPTVATNRTSPPRGRNPSQSFRPENTPSH